MKHINVHNVVMSCFSLLHRPVLKTRHPSGRMCISTLSPYKKSHHHHRSKSDAIGTIFSDSELTKAQFPLPEFTGLVDGP